MMTSNNLVFIIFISSIKIKIERQLPNLNLQKKQNMFLVCRQKSDLKKYPDRTVVRTFLIGHLGFNLKKQTSKLIQKRAVSVVAIFTTVLMVFDLIRYALNSLRKITENACFGLCTRCCTFDFRRSLSKYPASAGQNLVFLSLQKNLTQNRSQIFRYMILRLKREIFCFIEFQQTF